MGGRRKAFKVLKKVKPEKLKSLFDCGSCGFKNCIIIKINKSFKTAKLECDRCYVKYKCQTRSLDEPIDVYQTWLENLKKKSAYAISDEDKFSSEHSSQAQDVEKLIKRTQNSRKKVKLNDNEIIEESSQKQQSEDQNEISDDSLAIKEKLEELSSITSDDDDESYNVKKNYGKKKK